MRWSGLPPLKATRGFEAFERERHVRAAFARDEGVDLVDDDGFDGAELLRGRAGEHEIERFRRRDEDVAGMPVEACALLRRGVAGADA